MGKRKRRKGMRRNQTAAPGGIGSQSTVTAQAFPELATGTTTPKPKPKKKKKGRRRGLFGAIGKGLRGLGKAAKGIAKGVGGIAKGAGKAAGSIVKGAGKAAGGILKGAGKAAGGIVKGVGGLAGGILRGVGKGLSGKGKRRPVKKPMKRPINQGVIQAAQNAIKPNVQKPSYKKKSDRDFSKNEFVNPIQNKVGDLTVLGGTRRRQELGKNVNTRKRPKRRRNSRRGDFLA